MPSILATAALAALSGGRKLSDITACSHDICGRKLLEYHGDRHAPSATRGDYNTDLDANTIFPNYDTTKVSVANGKLVVTTTMKAGYNQDVRQCILTATPTIVDGSEVATTLTSVTFNPAASGGASVSADSDSSYDTGTFTFVAELDTPDTDGKSLGYIGVDVAIGLECTDYNWYVHTTDSGFSRSELLNGGNWGDGNPRLKTYGVYTDYLASSPFQVRYTFKESDTPADQLSLLGGVDSGLSATSTFGSDNLQVAVAGTATLKTEAGKVRFPEGEWGDFGQASTSNTIACTVEQTVKGAYKLSGWYDGAAGDAQDPISYDGGADTDCAGGICESRTHSAFISYTTDVGFQIPLSKYFDAQPTIQCVDAGASSTQTAAVDIDSATACGGAQCSLGAVAPGLLVSANDLTTENNGDDIFGVALTKAVTTFYDVAQSSDTAPWYDLDAEFDYRISVASSGGEELALTGSSGQIAALGTDIGGVQGALTTALGVARAKEIARPVVYGEERNDYTLGYTDRYNKMKFASKAADFKLRRSSADISVDVSQAVAGDGDVVYGGGSAIGDPTNFDGPGLAWRTDLGDASVTAGASTATSAQVLVDSIDAGTLTFFKTQAAVTDDVLFDQDPDTTSGECSKAYCQSPDGGTAWRCSAQSATFSLEVGKASLDNREADTVIITKEYSVDAQSTPALPTIAGSDVIVYKIAGSTPAQSHSLPASSDDTGATSALQFDVAASQAGARVFDCSAQASQTVNYEADFRQTCGARTVQPIAYSEPYAMVYSTDQVTPDTAASTTAQFSEYVLQRDGKDITFTVSPSQVGYALPFSSNLRVAVKYDCNADDEDVITCAIDRDAACTVGSDGVAACTLTGFQDASYDSGHALGHDEVCGGDNFACPQLTLNIYETFAIPDVAATGDLATMFKPDTVATDAGCGSAEPHLIGTRTIDISVDGSETTFKSQIEFYNNGALAPFAALAADASGQAGGATSEYATTIAIGRSPTTLETDFLEDDLTDLKLQLSFSTSGMSGLHTITNLGGDNYELYKCPRPSDFQNCELPAHGGQADATLFPHISMPGGLSMTVMVRKTGGGDPCDGKILGAPAYDGGVKFSVQKDGEQAHVYTLPILCHVERDVKVLNQVPSDSTDAWNDKFLDVTLTGSAIDYRKQVSISSTGLEGALRLGVGQSDLSALIARQVAGSDGALTARLTLDYIDTTGGCVAENLDAALLWGGAALKTVAGEDAEHTLQCPSNELGIQIGGVSIANGALLSALSVGDDNFKNFGDVFMIKMAMTGRDSELHDEVDVSISADDGSDESVQFLDGSTSENIKDKGKGVSDVFFRMVGRQDGTDDDGNPLYRIQCSTLTVVLTSKTTSSGIPLKFRFKIKCPRQNSASDASDAVNLEYGVEALHFGHTESTIKIKADPADAPSASVIHLGSCVGDVATPGNADGTCALTTGLQTFGGASPLSATGVLNLFAKCGGSTTWNDLPEETGTSITSTAYVARSYQHAKTHFTTAKFCSTTALHITVDKSATKEITIAVAADRNMDFVVHVSQAEWDSTGCPEDQYRLVTQVDMERKLQSVDSEFSSSGIENYERSSTGGLFSLFYKSDGTSQLTDAYEAGGSTLIAETVCKSATDAIHSLSFDMRVALNGVNYYSSASVQMSVSPPDSIEDDEATYDGQLASFADSLSIASLCDITGNPLATACLKESDGVTLSAIPTNENIQLTLVIGSDELDAFAHDISEPRISFDGKKSDETTDCDLYTSCQEIKDLDDTQFQAVVASNGAKADLRSGDKKTVTLQLSSLGGQTNIVVGWTVSRIHSSRRLRSVEHVTYKLGADGSVSKSSSFAVLPAVRDSEDASAVTTKEQITVENLDADGKVIDSYVYNQTTVQQEKSGEDHTLAVLGIVFGGLGSVAAIAVAFFVGCASRKDAQGVGSSFSTVAGGFSDRQPLFNRNRFAPSDF
jgi:hypothetical protein